MDGPSDPKKRRVHTPNPCGDTTPRALDGINAVLEKHACQIEALAAANKELEGRNAALEERCEALDRKYDALLGKLQALCREKCESLERSCDKLEVRCSSLERSIQVLKKDVSWKYSAPDIPRSHWTEQGRDEEYADIMEDCLSRIKMDAEVMRAGVESYYCRCLDNEGQLTILFEDALLPHFKELADAIQMSDGVRKIVIDNIELRPSALGILFQAMEGKVSDTFMYCIRFPDLDVVECYEIIATSIRRNHALTTLTWVDNQIPSDNQADPMIESVIDNRSIKHVTMENCFNQNGVNGCRALATLLTCGRPFEKLDFDRNGLSGIDDVAAALATNPQLKILRLSGNELNDSDAGLIAQALKQNTHLQSLYLGGDDTITSAGFEGIRASIYNPSSFKAMESCNHTCWVDRAADNCEGMTPRKRRNRKMYKLLSTRHTEGSNACHLNVELGEVIKLVPRVLECVKRCSDDRTTNLVIPLSIYFELIKSWMPPLFGHPT